MALRATATRYPILGVRNRAQLLPSVESQHNPCLQLSGQDCVGRLVCSQTEVHTSYVCTPPKRQHAKGPYDSPVLRHIYTAQVRSPASRASDWLSRSRPQYRPLRGAPFSTFPASVEQLVHTTTSHDSPSEPANADAEVWTQRISRAALTREDPRASQALALCDEAISSGIRPTNSMVRSILQALCTDKPREPTDKEIDHALDFFRRYLDNVDPANPPAIDLYHILLCALTSAPDAARYHSIATSLVEDLQRRNLPMDPEMMTTTIIMLMRRAPTFGAAYSVYRLLTRDPRSRFELDEGGYLAILGALCRLAENEGAPRPQIWYEVMNDMRMAGHTISAKAYTVFLKQLGIAATKLQTADRETRVQLVGVIKAIRQFITVDASIQPDVDLWNELMKTWQKAGCAEDAFQVWEHLLVSRQYNHASVSIVLDLCAYAGAVPVAAGIVSKLRRDRFRLNLDNWKKWLDCLCRTGKIDEGLRFLCMEMPASGVQPDVGTAELLLTHAQRYGQVTTARRQISRYLPKLWQQLPVYRRTGGQP